MGLGGGVQLCINNSPICVFLLHSSVVRLQTGDLSFSKGQVIIVTEKNEDTNTWWTGKVDGREGMFPANFVEVV